MITITPVKESELKLIWKIQIKAFENDFKENSDFSPGGETFEKFLGKKSKFIIKKICLNEKIIGALCIREYLKKDNWKISRIFILPEYQRKGYGKKTLTLLEEEYSFVKKWTLETSEKNIQSQNFYKKNGYIEKDVLEITKTLKTILYEKVML